MATVSPERLRRWRVRKLLALLLPRASNSLTHRRIRNNLGFSMQHPPQEHLTERSHSSSCTHFIRRLPSTRPLFCRYYYFDNHSKNALFFCSGSYVYMCQNQSKVPCVTYQTIYLVWQVSKRTDITICLAKWHLRPISWHCVFKQDIHDYTIWYTIFKRFNNPVKFLEKKVLS